MTDKDLDIKFVSRERDIWRMAKEQSESAIENAKRSTIFNTELLKLAEEQLKKYPEDKDLKETEATKEDDKGEG